MKVVADTNTFLAVALNEPEKDALIRTTSGHQLIAPEVLPYEIGNALTAMLKKGVLTPPEVALTWDAVRQIPVELRAADMREALRLTVRFQIYAYDAYFLDCALNGRFPLLTLDRGMRRCAQQLNVQILEF
ncbi:MAG TPA: PIN domain-containing protein [Desulfonatronum sp.]|nr:PIN domain-containing protein [Desulfonatronum sp.]